MKKPYLEVKPNPDSPGADNNQYRASVIGQFGMFQTGMIRITPPVNLTPEYLKLIEGDVAVRVEQRIVAQEATLLSFDVIDGAFPGLDDKERVRTTVQDIINDLGLVATKTAFREMLT